MLMRRRKTGVLYHARLNPLLRIGCHNDPLLEICRDQHWIGLGPQETARRFEILTATRGEINELALLTEYPLRYARDFTLRRSWMDISSRKRDHARIGTRTVR